MWTLRRESPSNTSKKKLFSFSNLLFYNSLRSIISTKGKTTTKSARNEIQILFRDWFASATRAGDFKGEFLLEDPI